MFISNNQLLELTIKSRYYTKSTKSFIDDLECNISASFLIVQLPEEQNLNSEDLNSDKSSVKVLESEKKPIGDYTYDADDRIAFDVSSLLKKGYCTYVICVPIPDKLTEIEIDNRQDKQFGFDFIIRKENSVCSNFDEVDDKIQKANPVFSFLNTYGSSVKLIFYRIFNRVFNTNRISFKMNNNPIVLMKLNYEKNNNLSFSFPLKELLKN